jgi:hypothetical protein
MTNQDQLARQTRSTKKPFPPCSFVAVVGLVVGHVLLQFVMPRAGLSLILNFDTSCYSGAFALFEKLSTNGSCDASQPGMVGFPFVINFAYNSAPQRLATMVLDSLPLPGMFLAALYVKAMRPNR